MGQLSSNDCRGCRWHSHHRESKTPLKESLDKKKPDTIWGKGGRRCGGKSLGDRVGGVRIRNRNDPYVRSV